MDYCIHFSACLQLSHQPGQVRSWVISAGTFPLLLISLITRCRFLIGQTRLHGHSSLCCVPSILSSIGTYSSVTILQTFACLLSPLCDVVSLKFSFHSFTCSTSIQRLTSVKAILAYLLPPALFFPCALSLTTVLSFIYLFHFFFYQVADYKVPTK